MPDFVRDDGGAPFTPDSSPPRLPDSPTCHETPGCARRARLTMLRRGAIVANRRGGRRRRGSGGRHGARGASGGDVTKCGIAQGGRAVEPEARLHGVRRAGGAHRDAARTRSSSGAAMDDASRHFLDLLGAANLIPGPNSTRDGDPHRLRSRRLARTLVGRRRVHLAGRAPSSSPSPGSMSLTARRQRASGCCTASSRSSARVIVLSCRRSGASAAPLSLRALALLAAAVFALSLAGARRYRLAARLALSSPWARRAASGSAVGKRPSCRHCRSAASGPRWRRRRRLLQPADVSS